MLTKKSGLLFALVALSALFMAQKLLPVEKTTALEPPVLKVLGMVTVDGVPAASEIEITSLGRKDKSFLNIQTSKKDGVFTAHLPAGDLYELAVRVHPFPPQIIELNAADLDSVCSLNTFADFISPGYDKKLEQLKQELDQKYKAPANFNERLFEQHFGATAKNGLRYKVQIGAYRFIENFNYNGVMGLPKIIRQTDNDAITRFTMGNFETYRQANELLLKLQQQTTTDAFIIATYNGQKKYLHELIEEKILN